MVSGVFSRAFPASRCARTGYPFPPARWMRSGITRKWRRKRRGSSFKFVRANPAAPGHAGNAGCLHSCGPAAPPIPRPCCACGNVGRPRPRRMRRSAVAHVSALPGFQSPRCLARAWVLGSPLCRRGGVHLSDTAPGRDTPVLCRGRKPLRVRLERFIKKEN